MVGVELVRYANSRRAATGPTPWVTLRRLMRALTQA